MSKRLPQKVWFVRIKPPDGALPTVSEESIVALNVYTDFKAAQWEKDRLNKAFSPRKGAYALYQGTATIEAECDDA